MPDFDTLIRGGTVVDGSGVPRYCAADVGITHRDAQIHWDPLCTIDGWHGVTSVTLGNRDFGFAPARAADAERAMLCMTRNEAIPIAPMQQTMDFSWETFPQSMDHLERQPLGVNVSQLVPVTPLATNVLGDRDQAKTRQPNARELAEATRLLHEATDAGAVGWSSQRQPPQSLAADLMVYDPGLLGTGPVVILHDLPGGEWWRVQCAQGYRWILVNGQVTFDNGVCTAATPGHLLRGGAAHNMEGRHGQT